MLIMNSNQIMKKNKSSSVTNLIQKLTMIKHSMINWSIISIQIKLMTLMLIMNLLMKTI